MGNIHPLLAALIDTYLRESLLFTKSPFNSILKPLNGLPSSYGDFR
jgi:hypothetical protein